MYYILSSCSTGKFTEENYLAGWYLFSGNGLIVEAATEIAFAPYPPQETFTDDLNLLTRGEIFGNVQLHKGISVISTFLGDPTLRLRYKKIKSDARLVIDKTILDFGNINSGSKKTLNFTIYNTGKEDLYVAILWTRHKTIKEPELPDIDGKPGHQTYLLKCEQKYYNPWDEKYKIESDSSISCSFTLSVYPGLKGEYESIWEIYSTDEKKFWTRLLVKGVGI
jgi:hypothetical protein